MNTQFMKLNECSIEYFVQYSVRISMTMSIQRLPDESVVIISGTTVEVIVSNTE